MKVSELKVGQGKVDIDLVVKSKSETRTFNKYGRDLRVANVVCADAEGGEIKVSLWNDDCDKVNVGDSIKIVNGYVSEFNGEKQLSSGKFGKIEVAGKTESGSVEKDKNTAEKPKKQNKKPAEDFNEDDAAF